MAAVSFAEQRARFQRLFGQAGLLSEDVTRIVGAPGLCASLSSQARRHVFELGVILGIAGSIFGPLDAIGSWLTITVFVLVVGSRVCRVLAGDGSEQMALLILFATVLSIVPNTNSRVIELAVYFVGLQLILSYFTAGAVKAVAPVWRSGRALELVFGSEAYGHPKVAATLTMAPLAGRVLGATIVVVELLFPLVLILPKEITYLFLGAGLIFHVSSALIMGLNTFAIIFPATYLCVLYVASSTSQWWDAFSS